MSSEISAHLKALVRATLSVLIPIFVALITPISAARAQATGAEESGALEEVVVTAQKRMENVLDVPVSISVLQGETLEALHAASLIDYAAYTPGFVVTPNGSPGQVTLTLRGLAQLSPASSVGIYLDDTPVGTSSSGGGESGLSLDMMPYDLDRVEVLKGPQGTLYGANSMGGLVKYVTRSPDPKQFEARLGTEGFGIQDGDGTGFAVRGMVNVPLIADTLALRASYFNQYTPGFIKNPTTGDDGENALRQQGGRLALLWQANENLSVKVQAIGQKIASDNGAYVLRTLTYVPAPLYPLPPDPGKPVATGLLAGDLTNPHALDEPFEKTLRYFSATVNWGLGFADLTSASSYQSSDTNRVQDVSPAFGPLIDFILSTPDEPVTGSLSSFINDLHVQRWTQELRLASPSGNRLEWMVGLYYDDERIDNGQNITLLDATGQPVAGLEQLLGVASLPSSYQEYSAFANATYKFTDAFDVSAGLRWAENDQRFRQISTGLVFGEDADITGTSGEHVTTYAVSPRYRFNANTMAYARVATGYRPGEPNVAVAAFPGIPSFVEADTTRNYEVGLKSEFLDHRASIDAAVYYIDWKDIQVPDSNGTVGWTINGGTAKTQGVELAISYSPIRNWRLNASGAYMDAELTQAVLGTQRWLEGAALPQAPQWSASLRTDYQVAVSADWSAHFGGGFRFIDSRFMNVQGRGAGRRANSSELASYHVVDLNAGLSNDRWNFSLYARNATNERAYIRDSFTFAPAYIVSAVLQPRTIGASVELKF